MSAQEPEDERTGHVPGVDPYDLAQTACSVCVTWLPRRSLAYDLARLDLAVRCAGLSYRTALRNAALTVHRYASRRAPVETGRLR